METITIELKKYEKLKKDQLELWKAESEIIELKKELRNTKSDLEIVRSLSLFDDVFSTIGIASTAFLLAFLGWKISEYINDISLHLPSW